MSVNLTSFTFMPQSFSFHFRGQSFHWKSVYLHIPEPFGTRECRTLVGEALRLGWAKSPELSFAARHPIGEPGDQTSWKGLLWISCQHRSALIPKTLYRFSRLGEGPTRRWCPAAPDCTCFKMQGTYYNIPARQNSLFLLHQDPTGKYKDELL